MEILLLGGNGAERGIGGLGLLGKGGGSLTFSSDEETKDFEELDSLITINMEIFWKFPTWWNRCRSWYRRLRIAR